MRFIFVGGMLIALLAQPASAEDLTLNDLPRVLNTLRSCVESRGVFSTLKTCAIPEGDLWVSVNGAGQLTLFRKRSFGDTTYAHGTSVSELLRDFASKLNAERDSGKALLDALGPFLPSQ